MKYRQKTPDLLITWAFETQDTKQQKTTLKSRVSSFLEVGLPSRKIVISFSELVAGIKVDLWLILVGLYISVLLRRNKAPPNPQTWSGVLPYQVKKKKERKRQCVVEVLIGIRSYLAVGSYFRGDVSCCGLGRRRDG